MPEDANQDKQTDDQTDGAKTDADKQTDDVKTDTKRPDWLPEQFKSPEDLAKSYADLRKKMDSAPKPDGPLKLQKANPLAEKLKTADASVNTILEAAGIEPVDIVKAFQADKKATDEQYAALDKLGYGKGIVDQIYGQMATYAQGAMDKAVGEVTTLAGGDAQLKNLLAFGSATLSDAQQAEMQQRLNDPAKMTGAVRELLQLHREAVGAGSAQPLVEGDGAAIAAGPISQPDLAKAMTDPRWQVDEAYTNQIKARLSKTQLSDLTRLV